MASLKSIDVLRVRGSYGYTGNVNNRIAPSTVIAYEPATNSPVGLPFAYVNVPGNPGLSWETVRQINLGVDFGLFSNRLSGSIEGYTKSTDNLILQAEIDPTAGTSSVFKNSASMRGRGVDIEINTNNLQTPNFKWTTEFSLSYATVEVKDFDQNTSQASLGDILNGGAAYGLYLNPIRGKSPYSVLSYRFAGLDPDNGNPRGYEGENVSSDYQAMYSQLFDTANYVYHGSAIPTVFGFLNNTFSFKGFSLTAGISYKLGYYFRKGTVSYSRLNSSNATHPDFSDRWQQPGDEERTTVPSRIYPANTLRDQFYANSTANVLRGDHIRFEYIRIAYDFSNVISKKIGINNLQVYFVANNLGILWRKNDEKIDPDYDPSTSLYPRPKAFTFGLRASL